MNVQRLPLTALAVLVLCASACSNTPTETSTVPSTGNLLIRVTQPCPLVGTVDVFAGNQRLGTLVMPGDTTFSVSTGSHSLTFVRGQETFGSNSLVQVSAGGTTVVTDPPDACMRTHSTP